ncbi:MerR family transcriptional regulator [Methanospirillum stamsii]|uniref:HTH merR-type domain-containing protein n=1 Tax=Methanospirillum stamsii TaxID=1277351 RepID=A0A2V2MTK5_9EURY|nr:MerR family transcriptional regulator [Methanospirillum stamsii]PWR69465.1 hypothetical protein DLD82_18130 [Methanospirillum stamsii]
MQPGDTYGDVMEKTYTTEQVAEILQVTPKTIRFYSRKVNPSNLG